VEPCERDAAILGALFARPEVATGIQLLAVLHRDVPQALGAALRGVGELGPADVDSVWALEALRRLPAEPVEIARIALALAAAEFEAAYPAELGPFASAMVAEVQACLDACAGSLAVLRTSDLRFSATLGPHGRGYGDTVIVGSGALPTEERDSWGPVVLALHELAVRAASRALEERGIEPSWARAERVALLAAERAVRGTPLAPHYTAWREALSTEGLVPEADVPTDAVGAAARRLSRAYA
jgi:hypothetical protein